MPEEPRSPRSKRRSCALIPQAALGLALAFAAILGTGCDADLGAVELPWSTGTSKAPSRPALAPAGSATAKPSSAKNTSPKGQPAKPAAEKGASDASDLLGDCDELPELSADERAGPPYEIALQKPSRPDDDDNKGSPPRYTALPDVTLSPEAASKIDRIDDAFFKKTGKHVVITSGTRDAAMQAKAMYKMIRLGADILKLYKNKEAVREIRKAYDQNARKSRDAAIEAMYDVIKAQIDRGVYISAHLRAGAVDVRNRTMTASQKRAFLKSVAEASGASVLEESKPPHYHLQLD